VPRFSVLVPTRDRPDLLSFCLEGLAAQTFGDVEVIVADNPVQAPARDVFDRWCRPGWRYFATPEPLSMADNWEFGAEYTKGEFLAVVIDKTILHPSALELAHRALEDDRTADLVSWWNDGYAPVDERHEIGKGFFNPTPATSDAARFDPAEELRKLFSFETRRGLDRVHYYRGKIVFGAFSRALLARIRDACGRVFSPLSPDYTSRIPALALTRGAIDVGRPLLLSYNSERSNGRRASSNASYAKSFVLSSDPDALANLPIRGLYASLHNLVAYDCLTLRDRLPPGKVPELHRRNLVRRAREDLDLIAWDSPEERDEQYAILEAEEARLQVTYLPAGKPPSHPRKQSTSRRLLGRFPPAERATRWALRRPAPAPAKPPPVFGSPVEAAFAADRHYTAADGVGITL
jgi:hypothetical protein